ncbi:MAG: hypothetical protein GY714_09110 [Desulfobacterales bacterium]|nr:hypothetical protein [Desulfobacterales bacterium]
MIKILFKTILIVFLIKYSCFAVCTPQPSLNPAIDVAWTEVFPMKIGGVTVVPGSNGLPPIPDSGSSVVCSCPAPPPCFCKIWNICFILGTSKDDRNSQRSLLFPNIRRCNNWLCT